MRNKKQIVLILFIAFLLAACGQKDKGTTVAISPDLKEILVSDTLRIATMYGSSSYFLYRDELMGFDYEMAKRLAKYLKVNLKISISKSESEMTQLLQERKVDILAYNTIETKELKKQYNFILPQPQSYQVLVQNSSVHALSDVTELAGKTVYVKANSIFHQRLLALNNEIGGTITIALAADSLTNDDLIEMVGEKKISYTLAYRNVAQLHKSYYKRLDCRMPVGFNQNNGWLLTKENTSLQAAIETWASLPETKQFQAELFSKYWERSPYFALRKAKIPKGALSLYDHLFKKYAPLIGWDWRLLAALAFHESGFDPSQRSWAGASGLMQLMPRTGANFGLNSRTIFDPEMNIEASVQYIKSLNMTFRQVQSKEERIKFILAGYNIGPAHILDAMALANKYGKNPHIWFNNVEYYLLKKSEPEFYRDKVVKYGYFRGKGSTQYVNNALATYQRYLGRR